MTETGDLFEFTDRYGGPAGWPDPSTTVCLGPCEGMGVYPEKGNNGWTFPTCPDCGGTGRATEAGD